MSGGDNEEEDGDEDEDGGCGGDWGDNGDDELEEDSSVCVVAAETSMVSVMCLMCGLCCGSVGHGVVDRDVISRAGSSTFGIGELPVGLRAGARREYTKCCNTHNIHNQHHEHMNDYYTTRLHCKAILGHGQSRLTA